MAPQRRFKVVIVGGGVGGLALANLLQYTDMDFVLLEKREQLDPQQGASIGILPNGARILDQIGCYDDLMQQTVSMESSASRREDGSIIGEVSDSLKLIELRTGYPVIFLDRQILLTVLADKISDKSNILLNQTIVAIDQLPDKAVVRCADGTQVEGDVIIGADGTYSFTRSEMWRHADSENKGQKFSEDKNAMSSEYKCLFGISKPLEGMYPGQTDRTYGNNVSTLSYVGKGGRLFWFVFVKMDSIYYYPNIPRFTEKDTANLVESIGSLCIRENPRVTVQDLYQNKVTCHLVAIEEAEYQQWSYGRIACLGDSIHKMTPNLGAGASSAIESATALCNVLTSLVKRSPNPSTTDIEFAFARYQQSREERVQRASRFSNKLTRVQALQGKKEYIYTHHIAPRVNDFAAETFSNFVIGAELAKHLPIPPRSTQGAMPFNPRQGWGFEEKKTTRMVRAAPLLALTCYCLLESYLQLSADRSGSFINGKVSNSWKRSLSFYLESGVPYDAIYGVYLLEASRLNNRGSVIQFPLIFAIISRWLGVPTTAALYFFLLYIFSPIERFNASDDRLTDVSYTSTVGPLIAILSIGSRVLQSRCTTIQCLAWWNQVSELQPFILSLSQWLLVYTVLPSKIRRDRLQDQRHDVFWIRWSVGILLTMCCMARVYRMFHAGQSEAFEKLLFDWTSCVLGLITTLWLALVFRDLREAGMIAMGWPGFTIAISLAFLSVGPSCSLALGWLCREEVITWRRHKDAVTTTSHYQRK